MRASLFRPLACLFALALTAAASAEGLVGLTTTNRLVTFDSATPGTVVAPIAITGLQANETILGIDFRPANHVLYGLGSTSRLYSLDPTTGAATQIGSAGAFTLSGTAFGFDFNLRSTGSGSSATTARTSVSTRMTARSRRSTRPSPMPPATSTRAPRRGSLAQPTRTTSPVTTTTLFAIDANLDILATQNPPNAGTLNTVGALGFNTSDLVGFDISPLTSLSFASLTAPTGGSSQLFTINLGNGTATLLGTIGLNVTLADISVAATPIPEPETYALIAAGLLALRVVARRRQHRRD